MRWEVLHDGRANSHWVGKGKPRRWAEKGTFFLEGVDSWIHPLRTSVQGAEWTLDRSAGWGMLTKPQPPAWSQGGTKPEYFMAPPSTKRLQNWPSSFGAVCLLKVRTWKQKGRGKRLVWEKGQLSTILLNDIILFLHFGCFSIGVDLQLRTSSACIIVEHLRLAFSPE